MTNKTTSAIDLVERRVALAINNARHDYVADADWLPTEEEVAEARAAIAALRPSCDMCDEPETCPAEKCVFKAEAADTITRLQAALQRTRNGLKAYLPDSRVSTPVRFECLIEIIDEALASVGGE